MLGVPAAVPPCLRPWLAGGRPRFLAGAPDTLVTAAPPAPAGFPSCALRCAGCGTRRRMRLKLSVASCAARRRGRLLALPRGGAFEPSPASSLEAAAVRAAAASRGRFPRVVATTTTAFACAADTDGALAAGGGDGLTALARGRRRFVLAELKDDCLSSNDFADCGADIAVSSSFVPGLSSSAYCTPWARARRRRPRGAGSPCCASNFARSTWY